LLTAAGVLRTRFLSETDRHDRTLGNVMKPILPLLALLALPASLAADQFGCPQCRSCGGMCVLKAEPVTEEETCYEVECERVCIPAVRFPWESCRTPRCGRVRLVARLKEETRERKTCSYEWLVVCPRCGRVEKNGGNDKKPDGAKAEAGDGVPPGPSDAPMPPEPMPPAAPNPEAAAAFPGRSVVSHPAPAGRQPLRLTGTNIRSRTR
jgi:hypothetical protein